MCIDSVMAKLSTPLKHFMQAPCGRSEMKTRTFFLSILLILLVPLFFNCSVNMLGFLVFWISQVSVQAFSDEDPQGRRTLGIL